MTWRLDAPNKLGVAWVIDIGIDSHAWLARCRNMIHGPHPLGEAKAAAVAMVKREQRGDVVLNPIRFLNYLQAGLVDGARAAP